jgi:hypothetical protein
MRRPLRPRDGRKTSSVSGPLGRNDCFRAGVFTKGWIGVQPQGKDRLQETSREQTVTTANQENVARTARSVISKCEVIAGCLGRGFAAGFSRHDSGVQWCGKENGPQRLWVTRGQRTIWRTVGPDIPRPVASPQSRTPFLRTLVVYHKLARLEPRSTAKTRCAEDTPTKNAPGGP